MREILFRGKTEVGKWAKGRLFAQDVIVPCGQSFYLIDNMLLLEEAMVAYEVIPETVGQYTGLKDKNGKKIFEGDYWLDTDDDYLVYVVEFRDGQFGFVCYGIQGMLMPYGFDEDAGGFGEIDFTPFTDWNMDLMEIDGNIHDNPELLKGGEE